MPDRTPLHHHAKVRLRQLMMAFAVALALLTCIACLSLKILTDIMGNRAERLRVVAERVQVAEAARADLLTVVRAWNLVLVAHERGMALVPGDEAVREREGAEAQGRLYKDLEHLRQSSDADDLVRLEKANKAVEGYFATRHHVDAARGDINTALSQLTVPVDAAIGALVDVSRGDAEEMVQQEARIKFWDAAGDWIGWTVAGIVVIGTALVVVGMFRYVFRPLLELIASMKQFAEGDRDARASPSPAAELATAAENFNEMADVITGQHSRMIDYLGGIAAEIRNPVQIMRVTLEEVAVRNKPLPAEDKLRARHAIVLRELSRLERTVDNFLDVSRIQWERLDLQQDRQDIRAILNDVVHLYETFSSQHQVSVSAPEKPVFVYADPGRLSQVFSTLVANAIESSPRGGIVSVDVAAEGSDVIVSVTDHGIGISKEDLVRIFEPFHLTAMTPRRPTGGPPTVALSVARRIVEAHRGRLHGESNVGEGSTFRVFLPIAEAPAGVERAPAVEREGAEEQKAAAEQKGPDRKVDGGART